MSKAQSELRDALPVGAVVGEYKVEALLCHGGYSVVYLASHAELEHFVALKEYLPSDLSVRKGETVFPKSTECARHYEEGKRKFLEEAKHIVEFKDDPGVVTCLGLFRDNGTAYLVLEYVDGMSLAELLRQRESEGSPLDEAELRSLVLPLLETLSRLHNADVLHRDIKPSNILVRRSDRRPVLIDFGAAKHEVAIHSESVAPFTEEYAALEQVSDGELGPWTDVYGIGAVMWRIVAGGKPPWEPPNPKKVELRASAVLLGMGDPLPSAAELGKGRFSPSLLAAIDKCLSIQASERTPNCGDLHQVIQKESWTGKSIKWTSETNTISTKENSSAFGPKQVVEFSVNGLQTRPWIRYFARSIDTIYTLILILLFFNRLVFFTVKMEENIAKIMIVFLLILSVIVMVFLESWMLHSFACTFGKWLCNIRVYSRELGYLSYRQAFRRSIHVWIGGVGLWIPAISMITMALGYFRLKRTGATNWDKIVESKVLHKKINPVRMFVILCMSIPAILCIIFPKIRHNVLIFLMINIRQTPEFLLDIFMKFL